MVVSLRQRKVFRVTVSVQGNGHVSSTPSGIRCGNVNSPVCSYEFGPGQVRLAAQSDDGNTRFIGWSGNCAPNVQVCEFTLDGTAAVVATAHFGATTIPGSASNCTAAPLIPGLRWIGQPGCSDPAYNHATPQCDGAGYYCRGVGNERFPADCRHLGLEAILRQPGGCYEVASFP
jgi:hypothetical protein